jgi:hypothetical protein
MPLNPRLQFLLNELDDSGQVEARAIAEVIRDAASANDMDDDTDISMARATAQTMIEILKCFRQQLGDGTEPEPEPTLADTDDEEEHDDAEAKLDRDTSMDNGDDEPMEVYDI